MKESRPRAAGALVVPILVFAFLPSTGCGSPPAGPAAEPSRVPARTEGSGAAATAGPRAAVDLDAVKLLDAMAKAGGALIHGHEVQGGVCYLDLDPSIWNGWSPKEQHRAMNLLVTANPIWKEGRAISLVVLRVEAVVVGELDSGADGVWTYKAR